MKLSPSQLDVLRAVDAGERRPKANIRTLSSLFDRGLIASRIGGDHLWTGWKLTPYGRQCLAA